MKFIGAIIILFFIGCNSEATKEKALPQKENEPLQSELELTDKKQNSKPKEDEKKKHTNKIEINKERAKKPSEYIFDSFLISESSVGIFLRGMTIEEVYNSIPNKQIKNTIGYGEFVDDIYDDYEIYDTNGKKILVLTPKQNGNRNSKINRILVLDDRFNTKEKIGLNSTFGDLKKHYSTDTISPDIEHIFLDVKHINARFSINKSQLKEGWWNKNGIDKTKIPDNAKVDGITIWW